jgi:hypothetical protein
VPTIYKRDTVQHVKWLLELDKPLINVKDREDCTNLDVFTIDPPTARDLDDALSVEEDTDGKYRVGVHIADVTCIFSEIFFGTFVSIFRMASCASRYVNFCLDLIVVLLIFVELFSSVPSLSKV